MVAENPGPKARSIPAWGNAPGTGQANENTLPQNKRAEGPLHNRVWGGPSALFCIFQSVPGALPQAGIGRAFGACSRDSLSPSSQVFYRLFQGMSTGAEIRVKCRIHRRFGMRPRAAKRQQAAAFERTPDRFHASCGHPGGQPPCTAADRRLKAAMNRRTPNAPRELMLRKVLRNKRMERFQDSFGFHANPGFEPSAGPVNDFLNFASPRCVYRDRR